METRIVNFFKGYLRMRITGTSYDRFLNLCAFHGIRLWDLRPDGETYTACISNRDFRRLRAIVRKSRTRVQIAERCGLPFFIRRYRKRKVYAAGIAAAFLFMFWLSAHIWNIRIEGNFSQTDDVIFEYLQQEGITHGMRKSQVDCKELAAQVRNYFTQFAWVAAELKGTRLIIHVKEGIMTDAPSHEGLSAPGDSPAQTGSVSSQGNSALAAAKSGTVVSIYVRKGRPLVSAGDEVEKGTLLVSGALPVYNDAQEVVSYQQVEPDADIVIRTTCPYRDRISVKAKQKQYTGRQKKRYLVRIGRHPFSLARSIGRYEQCDVFSEITQFRLMENFYIPLYVQKFTVKEYEIQEILYTKEECETILASNLEHFMKNLEEKGVQIFENDVKIEWTEKSALAAGTLTTGEYAVSRVALEHTEEE